MIINIPGKTSIDIKNVIFDFNGTIAIDGKLIDGVAEQINKFSTEINFHVLTADTFKTVERELAFVHCKVVIIPAEEQDKAKLDYLLKLGKDNTVCVGNGSNDVLMLDHAVLSVALIQDEGVCVEALQAADIALKSVMDFFGLLNNPNRLVATLRK